MGKKKILILVVTIICFVTVLTGVTYAWLTPAIMVNNNKDAFSTCFVIEDDYMNDDGTVTIGGTLFQSSKPKSGLSGTVAMKISSECVIEGEGHIYLTVNSSTNSVLYKKAPSRCENPTTLETLINYKSSSACLANGGKWVSEGAHSALKYAVYEDVAADPVSVGYIDGVGQMTLHGDFILNHDNKLHYIYIWLDGNLADNSYYNVSFDGYIHLGANQINSVFNRENPRNLNFSSEADLSTFQELRVDNKVVDSSNYTLSSSPTRITLKKEYLRTLSTGEHKVEIISANGTNEIILEIISTTSDTTFGNMVLIDNEVYADNVPSKYVTGEKGIDFTSINSDTNGKGLYYTNVNTGDDKTSYYFRGDVQNNYVKFGKEGEEDIYWRIVRVNEDGSVRLIKQDSVSVRQFNAYAHDNTYVGYMYGNEASSTFELTHTNSTSTTIKKQLDSWYTNNLAVNADKFSNVAGFCNDRSVAPEINLWDTGDTTLGFAKNNTVYGPSGRLLDMDLWVAKANAQPQFKCPNEERDLFTIKGSSKGNAKLDNPIGLITVDEAAYAGGVWGISNDTMYLANASSYWTMSPLAYSTNMYGANVWTVEKTGTLGLLYVYNETIGTMLRPVVNLNANIPVVLEGTGEPGSITNPYVIK